MLKKKKTRKEQLFDENFRPYGLPLKKFFSELKAENFNPFQKSYKLKSKYVGGKEEYKTVYVIRTEIEDLLIKKSSIFRTDSNYFLFNDNRTQEEKEDFEFLHSNNFDYKHKGAYQKSWFTFLKRFAEEFNINYNDIKFCTFYNEDEFETPKANDIINAEKTLNILQVAMNSNAPIPVINSLIALGLDYKSPYSIYFDRDTFTDKRRVKCVETTPLIKVFIDTHTYPERIKKKLLVNMLEHDKELMFGVYKQYDFKGALSTESNLFTLFKNYDLEQKNEYGMILYNIIKKDKEPTIIPDYINGVEENSVQEFLYNHCPVVSSIYQKELISESLPKKRKTVNNKRL